MASNLQTDTGKTSHGTALHPVKRSDFHTKEHPKRPLVGIAIQSKDGRCAGIQGNTRAAVLCLRSDAGSSIMSAEKEGSARDEWGSSEACFSKAFSVSGWNLVNR